jgi:hypothetical protein
LVLALFAIPTSAQAQVNPTLRQAVLSFETNVRWSAVSPAWRGRRASWQQAVQNAPNPHALAAQVLALESAMGWSAVQDSWHQERPGWVQSINSAMTDMDVAVALLALEATTRWSAMDEAAWRAARGGWVASLRPIAGR